jgi:hypothetical protein
MAAQHELDIKLPNLVEFCKGGSFIFAACIPLVLLWTFKAG